MAEWIKASGEVVEVGPKNNKKFTLEELQTFVDGYIEAVYLGREVMYVNEEGRLRSLPYNERASKRANRLIVGDVIVGRKGQM